MRCVDSYQSITSPEDEAEEDARYWAEQREREERAEYFAERSRDEWMLEELRRE